MKAFISLALLLSTFDVSFSLKGASSFKNATNKAYNPCSNPSLFNGNDVITIHPSSHRVADCQSQFIDICTFTGDWCYYCENYNNGDCMSVRLMCRGRKYKGKSCELTPGETAAIVIAVLVLLGVVGFLIYRRQKRRMQYRQF